MTRRLTSLLLLPLLLGGCLLPQPDTPPVGKSASSQRAGLPAAPTGNTPLLPQPDTPPVGAAPTSAGAATTAKPAADSGAVPQNGSAINNNAGVGAGSAGSTLAPTASASAAPSVAPTPSASPSTGPGTLKGKVQGVTLKSVAVTDEAGSTTYKNAAVGTDGSFNFQLAPGRYKLVLTTDKDVALKPSQVFTVASGETRTYTIQVNGTDAVVSEDAPLASPTP